MREVTEFVTQNFALICLVAGTILGALIIKAFRIGLQLLEIGDKAGHAQRMIKAIDIEWDEVRYKINRAEGQLDQFQRANFFIDRLDVLERRVKALE